MAAWYPLKRREFIRRLRALGFTGPDRGTRHQFLVHGQHRQTVPSNPDYSVPQVKMLLRQVEIIRGRKISAEE
jgi:predicted RNA binding protein YcfA (HicA-like mRNA interferase family)